MPAAVDTRQVRQYSAHIVRRDAHVSWSLRRCVRHVRGRMARPWKDQPRAVRRAVIHGCADGRRDNINLYSFVMRGIK
jgi:hypothetical protein